MDIQKIATYGTAAAVVGTGSVVGGNYAIDQQTGGPEKRRVAEVIAPLASGESSPSCGHCS